MSTAQAKGWHVEVVHPNSGHVHRPTVVGKPQRNPQVNGYPKIRIPVKKNDKWSDSSFEDATFNVYFNGSKQPIDRLEAVEQKPGETILKGRGGLELQKRVEKEVGAKPAWKVARDLVQSNTSYTANFDSPQNAVEENVQQQTADTESELGNKLTSIPDDLPMDTDGAGTVEAKQTCFFLECENPDVTNSNTIDDGSNDPSGPIGSDNAIAVNSDGEYFEYDFTTDYKIPSDKVGVEPRFRNNSDPDNDSSYEGPKFDIRIDSEDVVSTTADFTAPNTYGYHFGDSGLSSDLGTGSHTCRIEVVTEAQNSVASYVDCIIVYDTRYHEPNNFDNTVTTNPSNDYKYLDSPTLYPTGTTKTNKPNHIDSTRETPVRSVSGARVEMTSLNDSSGIFEVGVSNDSGNSWSSDTSVPFEHDFGSLGATVEFRFRLGGYPIGAGSRENASPSQGYNAQSFDAYTLEADLDDTPLVIDQTYDDELSGVLQDVADTDNAIFEFRRENGTDSIEWTHPGQRTDSSNPQISDFKLTKTVERTTEKAIVYGASIKVIGEEFTSNHGSFVDLNNDYFVEGKETVRDTSGGTVYNRGDDYEMDYINGEIKTLSGGSISDSTTIAIDYNHRTRNSYTESGVGSPDEITREIPALTTDRSCGLAARRLVEVLTEPLQEAQVVLPARETGWSVVESISPSQMPLQGNNLHIREVKSTPEDVILVLGDRPTEKDVISDIRDKFQSVGRKV